MKPPTQLSHYSMAQYNQLDIFLCVKVLHFLLLYNKKMVCGSRCYKDILDPTELQICGVVGEISSMKKGKSASYYDGEMSDGKAKVWV